MAKKEQIILSQITHFKPRKKPLKKLYSKPKGFKPKEVVKGDSMPTWEEHIEATYNCKCFQCPGLYANEVMNFVGFRGIQTKIKKGHARGVLNSIDIKGEVYEGEAHPVPIVPVTDVNLENLKRLTGKTEKELTDRYYIGILKYELEVMTLIFTLRRAGYRNFVVLMPRGHGKTYMQDWRGSMGMKFWSVQILLLSETDATLKVANWIYMWAYKNGYLKDREKFSQMGTYRHFLLHNDGQFDMYRFMDKKTVGLHEKLIVGDDVISFNWRYKPTDNQKAIDHWQSSLNPIIRTGLEVYGTRKYEGDPLQHIMETIKNIIIIKMSPYLECPHGNMNDNGTFDACEVCKNGILLAPEIHSHEELKAKMYEDWEAWYAEYMQNPHPTKGGMVDDEDIIYIDKPPWTEVQSICISVDSTEADLDSTDMVGIVSCAMLKNKSSPYIDANFPEMEDVAKFVFLDADVRKMPFRTIVLNDSKGRAITHRGIMETIDFFMKIYKNQFPHVNLYIAIERQGGGLFIIKEVFNDRERWDWFTNLIGEKKRDKKPEDMGMKEIGIRHTKDKTQRVFSELRYPIKSGQVKFSRNLWGTILMQQILTFPKGKHDDGVDSAGMGKDELAKRWLSKIQTSEPYGGVIEAYNNYRKKQNTYEGKELIFNPVVNSELEGIKNKIQKRRKGIF